MPKLEELNLSKAIVKVGENSIVSLKDLKKMDARNLVKLKISNSIVYTFRQKLVL